MRAAVSCGTGQHVDIEHMQGYSIAVATRSCLVIAVATKEE
jgi:hypothetical protein